MHIKYDMNYLSQRKRSIFMRMTVSIPDKLSDNLKRAASNRGISVSSLVAEAVEQYLIVQRRRALGEKALTLVGKVHVASDAHDMIEEGRRDDRA
jgi:metal-responsive CopG/Arc/MetJ family transcriptional regulator